MTTDAGARLPVVVELGAGLEPAARALSTQTVEPLRRRLAELLVALGLEGRPSIRVTPGGSPRAVRVRVQGVLQPYPTELLEQAWEMTAPAELKSLPFGDCGAGFPDAWLRTYLAGAASDPAWSPHVTTQFLAELAFQAIGAHPECLLGSTQVEALAARWDAAHDFGDLRQLEAFVQGMLRLGLGVGDRVALTRVVHDCALPGRPTGDVVEAAFVGLRSRCLEVYLNPRDLGRLVVDRFVTGPVSAYGDQIDPPLRARFQQAPQELYARLGIRLPEPCLFPSARLTEGTIAVKVNDVLGPPLPFSAVGVAEAVLAEVTRLAHRLLSVEDVEYELAVLHRKAFPELVEGTLVRFPLGTLTRTLRGLLAEKVSIRDLRGLLERLAEYDTLPVDPVNYLVLDERLPHSDERAFGADDPWPGYLAFVRTGTGLRNYISARHVDGQDRMHVIAVDAALEDLVDRLARGDQPRQSMRRWEQRREAICEQIWMALASADDPTEALPLLTRTSFGRLALRDLIEPELPHLPIVCQTELRPGVHLRPVAHVGVPSAAR